MFLHLSVNLFGGGGGLSAGGSLSRGVSVWGSLFRGVSVWGGSLGGLCPGGSLSSGSLSGRVSVRETPAIVWLSAGSTHPTWNAFLFSIHVIVCTCLDVRNQASSQD